MIATQITEGRLKACLWPRRLADIVKKKMIIFDGFPKNGFIPRIISINF
jgi:hypothetical protein